ncbi:MAG: DUF4097 domain-containing protein [Lachnospiraceae bacterium]|nr:DUF4097 domain-containing protein [Lachnospiraceae bacterium]
MKKFTKGCLMTALVLFLVGLALSVVCGLLGGFRQLSEMSGTVDIPLRWYRHAVGDWRIGSLRAPEYDGDSLENIEEIADMEEVRQSIDQEMEKKLKNLEGQKEQLALTAETLGSLEIDVEDCNVLILESEDAHVWFLVDGDSNRPYYTIENEHGKSELSIENEVEHHLGNWRRGPNDTVYLWLPKGCALEECDIDMGAGFMGSIFINARQMKVNLGAGLIETDGFEADELSLLVGAGELIASRITAGKADIEIGAGHLGIDELTVSGETDVEVSMGMAEINGTLSGDLDMECDMGEIVIRLPGSEAEHSYNVECGMGSVSVGSYSRSGFATVKSWNSGKNSKFDINCNVGNVSVMFEE